MIGSNSVCPMQVRCDATHACPARSSQLLRGAPLSDGKVGFAWKAAVGPAVERATQVKLERRVLHRRDHQRAVVARSDALVAVDPQTPAVAARRRRRRAHRGSPCVNRSSSQRRPHADRQVSRRAERLHRDRSSARWSSPKPCAAPASTRRSSTNASWATSCPPGSARTPRGRRR